MTDLEMTKLCAEAMGDKERKQIGWQLRPIYETKRGMITTQAFILCCQCGGAISGTGGPMHDAYCMKCVPRAEVNI